MSDLVITAANVKASDKAKKRTGKFGATVTQGQTVYEDTSANSAFKLADNNGASAAITSKCAGIALNAGANGQDAIIVESDPEFTPGGTLSVGESYYLSATPGGLCPVSDVNTSGMYPVFLLVAYSTTQGNLQIVRGSSPKP